MDMYYVHGVYSVSLDLHTQAFDKMTNSYKCYKTTVSQTANYIIHVYVPCRQYHKVHVVLCVCVCVCVFFLRDCFLGRSRQDKLCTWISSFERCGR